MASGSTGNVFLVTSSFDPRALIEAKRAGVKKLFSHPIKKEEIKNALWELKESKREASPLKRGKKRATSSTSWGVKGSWDHNSSRQPRREPGRARQVTVRGVDDMTLPFGGIPIFLNVQTLPDWHEVARVISHVNPILLQNILLRHPSGIFVLLAFQDRMVCMRGSGGSERLWRFSESTLTLSIKGGQKM